MCVARQLGARRNIGPVDKAWEQTNTLSHFFQRAEQRLLADTMLSRDSLDTVASLQMTPRAAYSQ